MSGLTIFQHFCHYSVFFTGQPPKQEYSPLNRYRDGEPPSIKRESSIEDQAMSPANSPSSNISYHDSPSSNMSYHDSPAHTSIKSEGSPMGREYEREYSMKEQTTNYHRAM